MNLPSERDVLEKLVAWGESEPSVRALILTSSRTRPNSGGDVLSDYDLIVAVRDEKDFAARDDWILAYDRPMTRWGDESALLGLRTSFRGAIYRDGARVDYTIWPEELLDRVSAQSELPEALDVGYRVLLDKDRRTAAWQPPTYRAQIPSRPTRAEYEAVAEEFWWDTTYVAKALWRGELFFAKFVLEYDVKSIALRRFLEWRVEIEHDWSLRPGAYGRGLERRLPDDLWSQLEST